MKKFLLLIIMIVCLSFAGCSSQEYLQNVDNMELPQIEHSYAEDMSSIDTVIKYSTNIVKASLVSIEEFNGSEFVYLFTVEDDFTDNTPNEIHMYDAYNKEYIEGHSYYLFLCRTDNPLYPHTIFTTVRKDLIVDAAFSGVSITVEDADFTTATRAESIISTAVDNGIVGSKIQSEEVELVETNNLQVMATKADLIAKIELSNEELVNKYASRYTVTVLDMVKGSEEGISQYIMLEPGLDMGEAHYLFMIEDPSSEGNYLLFSREIQTVSESNIDISALSPQDGK